MGRLVPLRLLAGDPVEMSDEALLAACGTGDRAALGGLFDRFNVAVYRFVARMPHLDPLDRDDIVQATFLELPRAAAKFQGHSAVRTWILGIATNVARHHTRSRQRRSKHHDDYARAPSPLPEQPDVTTERHQLLARIAAALELLPYDQRIAFMLCDLEQLPGAEVARVLEIPEGTLWRRLHVARKTLRATLAEPS